MPPTEAILAEINGWYTNPQSDADGGGCGLARNGDPHHGPQIDGYPRLKSDGSTACGGWVFSRVFRPPKSNKADSRPSKGYLGHSLGFSLAGASPSTYNSTGAAPARRTLHAGQKFV